MEWVEVTAKTVEEAKHLALDRLGVAVDDAEFEVLQQPTKGLFGLMRGEARVRARVRPTAVRPKRDRRDRSNRRESRDQARTSKDEQGTVTVEERSETQEGAARPSRPAKKRPNKRSEGRGDQARPAGNGQARSTESKETSVDASDDNAVTTPPSAEPAVEPAVVGEAAAAFVTGLATAFGATATAEVVAEGADLEVRVSGDELGLLIGPGGRTLAAIQDLARVAAQRKLGDHDTRLKIDIAGYREKRRLALEKFARTVAADVVASGRAKALEPMSSADRKVVHDTVTTIEGVVSRSDGDEPARRVVIAPA